MDDTDSAEYKLIFDCATSEYYFLGSAYSRVDSYCGGWGLCNVGEDYTGVGWNLAASYGNVYCNGNGVRPVVSLDSYITLEESGTEGTFDLSA